MQAGSERRKLVMRYSLIRQPETEPRLSGQLPVARNGDQLGTLRFVHVLAHDPVCRGWPLTDEGCACLNADLQFTYRNT